MRGRAYVWGGALGAGTAALAAGVMYLAGRLADLPFVPFDLFDWLARILPGPVVTFGIDLLINLITGLGLGPTDTTAKTAERLMAVLLFLAVGIVAGLVLTSVNRRERDREVANGIGLGAILLLMGLVIEASLGFPPAGVLVSSLWLALVFLGWGGLLGWRLAETGVTSQEEMPETSVARRDVLTMIGLGGLAALVAALGLDRATGAPGGEDETVGVTITPHAGETSGPAESPSMEALDERIEPVPGTRPELTANEDFYQIDINTRPPVVDPAEWRLELTGLVDNPLSLTLEELRSRPAVSQALTLSCISNRIGGDLISSSVWTGVRLRDLLEEAGLHPRAREVHIEAADGFYESVSMEDMMDERTLLVYAMNDEPLPLDHGFPLRIFIPNRFGMKQPKWITRMEVIDHEGPGYWVERGWSAEAIPHTTSVIDVIATDRIDTEAGTLPIGGIAYAGDRGISKVEVQVDDGPWEAATLRTPPLSPLTWVQWRYEWPFETGGHTVRVRAYDGTGALQPTEFTDPRPAGATGIHSRSVNVRV